MIDLEWLSQSPIVGSLQCRYPALAASASPALVPCPCSA